MKLLIAIPALNEEDSIRSIIEKSLRARTHIIENAPVTEVVVTVVSDGSTDRTVEIAQEYQDRIHLIVFPKNRGYGVAITEAWLESDADLLSFLDADGTCDPEILAQLCTELEQHNADVVLGCRLHSKSHMPLLRRVGNVIFATIMSLVSFTRVRDVASGMRVVRRTSLPLLFPLPGTLDFTPAMSARAILSDDLKIREVDMPYHERAGESKLNPLTDGFRFLRVILRTVFLYSPSRPLGLGAILLGLCTLAMMSSPISYYFQNSRLEEWMIYRFLVSELLAIIAVLLVCAGHLSRKAVDISLSQDPARNKHRGLMGRVIVSPLFWFIPGTLVLGGVALVWDAWLEYLTTDKVYEHWSRFVAMVFFFSVAAILLVTKAVDYCMNLLADRLQYLRHDAASITDPRSPDGAPERVQ